MFLFLVQLFFFFKQNTSYDLRIRDWSSDVSSSDRGRRPQPSLPLTRQGRPCRDRPRRQRPSRQRPRRQHRREPLPPLAGPLGAGALRTGRSRPLVRLDARRRGERRLDRKSVVEGKSVSVRVDLGGRRIIKKKTTTHTSN